MQTNFKEFMEEAPISDTTRGYLIALGAFDDLTENLITILERDFGAEFTEKFQNEQLINPIAEMREAILTAFTEKIKMNLCEQSPKEL